MEDPLLLIRKQEEETKQQITSNPVKMKHLQQLVSFFGNKNKVKVLRKGLLECKIQLHCKKWSKI